MSPLIAVGAFCSCLTGVSLMILQLDRAGRARQQWIARRDRVLSAHRESAEDGDHASIAILQRSSGRRVISLPELLGYNAARRRHYRIAPAIVFGVSGVIALMALIAGSVFALWIGIAGAIGSYFLVARLWFSYLRAKTTRELYTQFPDALAIMVRSVRVGLPVTEALRILGQETPLPTRVEFANVADQIAMGIAIERALNELADGTDMSEYRFLATTLYLQSQTGGGLAETLENLGDTIRKRLAASKRGLALASEARTSIYVLLALPMVVGIGLSVMNPSYMAVLFFEPSGQKLLALACGMLCVGYVTMQAIIKLTLQ